MRMRWIIFVVLFLFLIVLLCACSQENEINIKCSPNNFNILELTTRIYSLEELTTIANLDGDIYEFESIYPIECIRNINSIFRVAYRGERNIAIIYFDETGKKTLGRIYSISCPKSSFDNIMGLSLNEIMELDSLGDYLFLYTGRYEPTSFHYTSDGYLISVTYSDSHTVIDVQVNFI